MNVSSLPIEERLKAALEYLDRYSGSKIAKVARDFDVPRLRLLRRLEGRGPKNGNPEFHTKLSKAEETALCRYIDRLDNINLAVRREFIQDTANCILKARASKNDRSPPQVGSKWVGRFIKRHNYSVFPSKVLDANRQASEDVEMLNEYFQKLRAVIEANGVVPDDIWNMDETGFQIGVGKDQLVVTRRRRAQYFGLPTNRESATAIEAVSAGGKVVPLFLILSGQVHMSQWYQVKELEGDTVIGTSPTGYSNDRHSLSWLKHFDHHSKKQTVGSKRLLLMDGYSSHTTKEFIQYCDDHGIIPFGYPPHSTHLVQPLDVVVFQPYKHYHAKALDLVVRDGVTNITKLEFLSLIQGVRNKTFTKITIQAAFRETGIVPFNPIKVLDKVARRRQLTPPNPTPNGPHSSPFRTPVTLRQMNKVAWKIKDRMSLHPDLDDEFKDDIDRFLSGALAQGTELVHTLRDLGRTQLAEQTAKRRRSLKNKQLQSGGVLTVAQARGMVQEMKNDELAKARRVVERAEKQHYNGCKKWFMEAAKISRKWRIEGRLQPMYVIDYPGSGRLLRRA
ncbi:hypothetical protein HIM_10505 [Hirsutella minnesotensis 3608]|uniref:HTH CENPB-type domain-containing protein n=1 Tax=Hirsutella minnesotensis 3608 TaxID=1043627 RepID=A0A0F7ZX49_9HYPO|nr:hypothetical protein HIM_10505 [Hirsutella minnesotensis 3608]